MSLPVSRTDASKQTVTEKKIKAVLFDLGETLLDFGKVNKAQVFHQGAQLTHEFLKSRGQPVGSFRCYYWRNMIALRFRHFLSNITGRDFNALVLLRKVGTKKGIKLTNEQWQNLTWLWYEPLSRIAKTEPNITETLTSLKKLGLKLGIVSNTFVNAGSLDKHLRQLGLLDFFGVRLYSCDFEFRKPDTRIFKIAAERIGEIPENILFVGDHIDKDIKAAARAGMQAILKVASANTKKIPKAVRKIERLSELPAFIERINTEVRP